LPLVVFVALSAVIHSITGSYPAFVTLPHSL